MFWLCRNRFVGSYCALIERRRSRRRSRVGVAHAFRTLVDQEVHVRAEVVAREGRGETLDPVLVRALVLRLLVQRRGVHHDRAVPVGVGGRVVRHRGHGAAQHADLRHAHLRGRRLEVLGRSSRPRPSRTRRRRAIGRRRAGGIPPPRACTSPDTSSGAPCRRSAAAIERNGAIARSPASTSPTWVSIARITSEPWNSSGRNGIGGAGITFAIVVSSSGAACASAMNAAIVSGVAGRKSSPPTTVPTSWSRRCRRVATPKLPPPPRIAQKQIGVMLVVDVQHLTVGGHDLGGEQGIDREPVRPGEEPDATAERDATDADRAANRRTRSRGRARPPPPCTRRRSVPSRAHAARAPASISSERMSTRSITSASSITL